MTDGRRVLVVEDEALIRESLQLALEDEGYVVQSAANGRVALGVLGSFQADLIILDLMMPVMDGWAFRAAQRQRPELASIPVILLSGARGLRSSAEQLGVQRAIPKPFDLDEVLLTVSEMMG
jgi:CheY-like chemotaxis protein